MKIAAFFDIDGTLLAPPSLERRFLSYLRWRGQFTLAHQARWLGRFLWLMPRGWLAATEANKAHLAGVRAAALDTWIASLGRRPLPFYVEAVQRVEWHAAQGHRIFLVSGTLKTLAEAAAAQLPVPAVVCATQLAVRDVCRDAKTERVWTGERIGEAVCGQVKAGALEQFASSQWIDLARSYAYGDAWNDRWMLERVGHPAAVNPSRRLTWLARRRGWPLLHWTHVKSTVGVAARHVAEGRASHAHVRAKSCCL
jgi:putative phosphoserine phosphatase/1-acylglycerol-3-phosphate O-acyltransferase